MNGGKGLAVCRRPLPAGYFLYSAFMAVVTGWLFAWAFTLPLKGTLERRAPGPRVLVHGGGNAGPRYYWLPMAEMSQDSMRSLFMTPPTFLNCPVLTLPNSWNAFTPACRGCQRNSASMAVRCPLWRRRRRHPEERAAPITGVLELKRAAVAGETVVEGRMLRVVEAPLLAAAARTPEQDVPVLGKEQDKYGLEAKGRGGHVEVELTAGEVLTLRELF